VTSASVSSAQLLVTKTANTSHSTPTAMAVISAAVWIGADQTSKDHLITDLTTDGVPPTISETAAIRIILGLFRSERDIALNLLQIKTQSLRQKAETGRAKFLLLLFLYFI